MAKEPVTSRQTESAKPAEAESRADKIKRVLDSYRHDMNANAPRNAAELQELEELLSAH